jgi:hypothetical protein
MSLPAWPIVQMVFKAALDALQTRNQLLQLALSGRDATELRTGKTRSSNRRTASGLEMGVSSWLPIQSSSRRN